MSEKKRASRSEKRERVIEQAESLLLTDELVGEEDREQAAGGEEVAALHPDGKVLAAT